MASTTEKTCAEPELASVSNAIGNTQDDIELASSANVPNAPKLDDPFLVTFETPFDPTNPKDWSRAKKWTVTDVLSATGFNRIMVSTIMAPAITTIAAELNMSSAESVMALSIYLLATAFGPLVIGPLSEVWGRKPILHASNIWFLIWNIVCGFAKTKGTLIAARFLAGFGASAIYALAGGVLGDVWKPEERGKSLSIYVLIPLLGAAVGPIIGGFMAERTTWRWMFWSTSIFQAVMIVASFLAFHETYAPLILKRKAAKLRKETGDQRYVTAAERLQGDAPLHISRIVGRCLARPLRLLAFHPIVQYLAFLSAFYYGILYIVLSTFSDLWVKQYHERIDISGLHYITLALGEILGSQVTGPSMDRTFKYLRNRANGEERPEWHVPMMLPGALLGPIGLLWYGWAAQARAHWAVVDLGALLFAFGGQIAGMPIQAYIIDSYPEYASSATAASQFSEKSDSIRFSAVRSEDV
ncbi:putative efflux pump mfs2 [Pseudocercospora fuligena]|uniref:Putative efflux pump mfs2 n=1 Tax=Pseudocercospora fuligena TaxID=685502 RepID=A0A8H6RBT2_9PEZI|nr:putative efflux pump mfs2 [Pseudocercospora fuligena]